MTSAQSSVANGALGGRGLALGGLILGYASAVLTVVLGAVAIDAQRDYVFRGKLTEGLVLAGPLRTRIAETFVTRPTDMSCDPGACRPGAIELGPRSTDSGRSRIEV